MLNFHHLKAFINLEWVKERRDKKRVVTYLMIRSKALEIANNLHIEGFKASNHYIQRFCDRNDFTYRKPTHKAQEKDKSGADCCREVLTFINEFNKEVSSGVYRELLNMDETPYYFDTVYDRTVDEIGKKSVEILTTGNEKSRCTLTVTISSSGAVLPGYLIYKSKSYFKFDLI